MKYSCYGCKYQSKNGDYPCTTCGKYVLSEDGESTVYVYNNWAPKEILEKDKIHSYDYKDLNDKTLLMEVIDNEEGIFIYGTDIKTGITYVLFSQTR